MCTFSSEIKHVFRAFIAWWTPKRTFGRIREQISENPRRRILTNFASLIELLVYLTFSRVLLLFLVLFQNCLDISTEIFVHCFFKSEAFRPLSEATGISSSFKLILDVIFLVFSRCKEDKKTLKTVKITATLNRALLFGLLVMSHFHVSRLLSPSERAYCTAIFESRVWRHEHVLFLL